MDYINVKLLLEKYWDGETSLQEETTLREYFNQSEVADDLKGIQPMFQYFQQEKTHRIENDNFDDAVLAQLETRTIRPLRTRTRVVRMISRVAAVALIAVCAYFAYDQFYASAKAPEVLTYEDLTDEEKLAYEQTKAALAYVSLKLNQGTNIAATNVIKVQKKTEKVLKFK